MNFIMMVIFLVLFLIVVFWKSSINNEEKYFISIDNTKCLKGIMSIIVVLVHIPARYSNVIQDAIGSFGYVCVTFFFIFSAYGLMYSKEHKKDYLKKFWKNRIAVLLIPYIISNLIALLVKREKITLLGILGLYSINFITILILFYILFYFTNIFIKNKKIAENVLIVLPIIYSVINFIFKVDFWRVETLGISYGILLYLFLNNVVYIINKNRYVKLLLFAIFSLLFGIEYLRYKFVFFGGNYILKIILGISLVWFVIAFTNIVKLYNRVLCFLGHISYEIYLLHTSVIIVMDRCPVILNSWQYIYSTLFFTILFAYALSKLNSFIVKRVKGVY